MNKLNLIILILIGVALFILGGGFGSYYQAEKLEPQINALRGLSSEVIPSIVAYGKITKIDGKNLTLTYGEGSITVKIRDNAPVYYFIDSPSGEQTKKIRLEDIKLEDSAHVSISISSDGQLEGTTVAVHVNSTK